MASPLRINVHATSGVAALHDAGASVPLLNDRKPLEDAATAGRLFFFSAEDTAGYRLDVYVEDPIPPEREVDFQPHGGTFRLDAPSGQIRVSAGGRDSAAEPAAFDLPPGSYALRVMGRRPFDAARHDQEMRALLGEADWRFEQRAMRFALIGCLPMVLALLSVVLAVRRREWHGLLQYTLPLVLLGWAPHVFRRASRRYQDIQRRMREHENAKADYLLRLTRIETPGGLTGGFIDT